jgi:hypothetical protein
VTFSATGSPTLTATAVDQYGETGTATVTLNVVAIPNGPIPHITSPADGSSSGGNYFLDGTVDKGNGTITAVWTFDGVPFDTQTVAAGSNVPLEQRLHGSGNGSHTITLTATDSDGLSNSDQVTVETVIVR